MPVGRPTIAQCAVVHLADGGRDPGGVIGVARDRTGQFTTRPYRQRGWLSPWVATMAPDRKGRRLGDPDPYNERNQQ